MNQEIKYKLEERDLLEAQMYSSTQKKSHRFQRLRSTVLVALTIGGAGSYFLTRGEIALGFALLGSALLWIIASKPIWKWRYKIHFIKHIKESNQGMIGIEATLRIDDENLFSQSSDGSGTLAYSGIESITELAGIYAIKLKQSLGLIIPKRELKSEDLRSFMQSVSEKTNLPIEDKTQYKWK